MEKTLEGEAESKEKEHESTAAKLEQDRKDLAADICEYVFDHFFNEFESHLPIGSTEVLPLKIEEAHLNFLKRARIKMTHQRTNSMLNDSFGVLQYLGKSKSNGTHDFQFIVGQRFYRMLQEKQPPMAYVYEDRDFYFNQILHKTTSPVFPDGLTKTLEDEEKA